MAVLLVELSVLKKVGDSAEMKADDLVASMVASKAEKLVVKLVDLLVALMVCR